MSANSYADVVATGSTTPVSAAEESKSVANTQTEVESTPEPMDLDSKVDGENEDSKIQTQLPSPNPSPKAEKKQKEQNLAPAPVPSVSAWGSAASSRSNSNVSSVDTKHWPSPHEQPQVNGSASSKKISAVKSSKEKWVPFKASVVLPQPGSKKSNNHGQKRNSNKNNNVLSNNNKQVHNDSKKRKNKTEKRPTASTTPAETKEAPKAESKTEGQPKSEQQSEQSSSKPQASAPKPESTSSENTQIHSHNSHHANHQASNHHNSHNHHSNSSMRFQNNQFQQFIPFQPFPVQGAFPGQTGTRPFRPYSNNRRFNKYQNNGYNNQYRHHNNNFNSAPFNRRNIAHLNKSSEPLFSLIKQIEYYFSIENLLKDIFLRKQMNSEGWLDLTVISSFYRMSVLSAGDFGLIRKAIDELNGELLELAEFSNNTLKVRVKENYNNWVLPVEQREANGQDESEPVNVIQPDVKEATTASTEEHTQEESTEATPVTAAPEEVSAN